MNLFSAWLAGWVDGVQIGPSIFLKLAFSIKPDELMPNMAQKNVYGY